MTHFYIFDTIFILLWRNSGLKIILLKVLDITFVSDIFLWLGLNIFLLGFLDIFNTGDPAPSPKSAKMMQIGWNLMML